MDPWRTTHPGILANGINSHIGPIGTFACERADGAPSARRSCDVLTASEARRPSNGRDELPDFDSRDIGARVDEMCAVGQRSGWPWGWCGTVGSRISARTGSRISPRSGRSGRTRRSAIASITKTFTAIAVMQLWEQGRIDLDAPASEYLRSYRLVAAQPGDRPATVRHLLTHTAGIPRPCHPWGLIRPDFGESVPGRPAAADPRRVLPREPPARGRAGDPLHLRQPRVRRRSASWSRMSPVRPSRTTSASTSSGPWG